VYLLPFQVKVALPALRFLANALLKDSLVVGPVAGRSLGLGEEPGDIFFFGVLGLVSRRLEGVPSFFFSIGFRSSLSISGAAGRAESLRRAGLLVFGLGGMLGRSLTRLLSIVLGFLRPRPPVYLEPPVPPVGLAGALVLGLGFAGEVVCVLGFAGEVFLGALGLAG